MKNKIILPVSRGELRAVTITTLVICLSVILPPHLVRIIQPQSAPQVEIKSLARINSDSISSSYNTTVPGESSSRYASPLNSTSDNTPRGYTNPQRAISNRNKKAYDKSSSNVLIKQKSPPPTRCREFDPNTIPGDTLTNWGWHPFIVRNMLRYRNSGGRFRKAEDLLRTYGMDSMTYSRIADCIKIAKKIVVPVYVNAADTSQWMALPGIGPVLSKRIVKFRNRLGGFHTIDQIANTYGLSEETFSMIRPYLRMRSGHKTINLTTATVEELASHPYISEKQARVMMNYFTHHGRPQSLDELSNLYIADSTWLRLVRPYFTTDPKLN